MQPDAIQALIATFAIIGTICAVLAPLALLSDWLEARANRRAVERALRIQAHNPFLRRQAD